MSHTVDQATRLWCPMSRYSASNRAGGSIAINEAACCRADKCAMWRWQPASDIEQVRNVEGKLLKTNQQRRGYCGLAGRPEVL